MQMSENSTHDFMIATPCSASKAVGTTVKTARLMMSAELGGLHEHTTECGQRVQIWRRDGKYLARGRWQGQQFGVTLGTDEVTAGHELRRLLTEIENGTFVPRREARKNRFNNRPVPRHDLRGLINVYINDRRRLNGPNTARDLGNRLAHVLDFAEQPTSRKKWSLAVNVNRLFAIELRAFLNRRKITANGRPGSPPRNMSIKMIRLCLEALRGLLNWASRSDVHQLPAEFANPITEEILGPKPSKDPLRSNPVPLDARIRIVQKMDDWQLLHLSTLLIIPTRFEDVSGAIISDFNLATGTWHLGERVNGNDFNKSRVKVEMPLPPGLVDLLRLVVDSRADGPMFRSRSDWKRTKKRRTAFQSRSEFELLCHAAISSSKAQEVETEQGRKNVIRKLLTRCGSVTTDAIGKELKALFAATGADVSVRPYEVRSGTTTDMNHAGIRHLEHRYLSMHTVNDILYTYTSLDPIGEMRKYFRYIEPLLEAVRLRASELRLLRMTCRRG